MDRKRYPDENALKLLCEIELKMADGDDLPSDSRGIGVRDAIYGNWPSRFGRIGTLEQLELRSS